MTGNGECECLKIVKIGQSAAKFLYYFKILCYNNSTKLTEKKVQRLFRKEVELQVIGNSKWWAPLLWMKI